MQLSSGVTMPTIGFGTWPMGNAAAEKAVSVALEVGYRLVDTAQNYANEPGVGRAIRHSGVPRDAVFVTTKLDGGHHGRHAARDALQGSLERLGLRYVDLYLIHWPVPHQDRYLDAWWGMLDLRREGLARTIGVSNFKPAHLARLIRATGEVPAVNQIQMNPRVPRREARRFHDEHGIVTQSWAPIGSGTGLLDEPVVRTIAERHERSPAQVVLRWHLDRGVTVVVKSAERERMMQNRDVAGFTLTALDVQLLDRLDRGESAAVDSDLIGY
jgi:2,5-diketo-D-gluconate reductase A